MRTLVGLFISNYSIYLCCLKMLILQQGYFPLPSNSFSQETDYTKKTQHTDRKDCLQREHSHSHHSSSYSNTGLPGVTGSYKTMVPLQYNLALINRIANTNLLFLQHHNSRRYLHQIKTNNYIRVYDILQKAYNHK